MPSWTIAILVVVAMTGVAVSGSTCLTDDSCTKLTHSEEGQALLQMSGGIQEQRKLDDHFDDDINMVLKSYEEALSGAETLLVDPPGVAASSAASDEGDDSGLGVASSKASSAGMDIEKVQSTSEEKKKADCNTACTYGDKQCAGPEVAKKFKPYKKCFDGCKKEFASDNDKLETCKKEKCAGVKKEFQDTFGKVWGTLSAMQKTELWGCYLRQCVEGQCHEGEKIQKSKKELKFLKKHEKKCEVDTCMERHDVAKVITSAAATRQQCHDCMKQSIPSACMKQMKKHHKQWKRKRLGKSLKKTLKKVKTCKKTTCKDQSYGVMHNNKKWCTMDCANTRCYGDKATKLYKDAKACAAKCDAENTKKEANAKCKADNCKAKWAAALANYHEVYTNASDEAKKKINDCSVEKCVQGQCKDFTEKKKAKSSRRRRAN